MYSNASPSRLKNGATSSSWGVKSKQLETVPPANISAHVGWRIQSTTKEIKSEAWARLWHSHYHYKHEGGVNAGHAEGGTCHPWRSWKMQSSLGVPLLALLTTFSIVFDCVVWWNSVFAWWCLSLWPCLISFLCNDCRCIVGLLPTITSVA